MSPQNYFYDDAIAFGVFEWLDIFEPFDASTLAAVRAFPIYGGRVSWDLSHASMMLRAWADIIFLQSATATRIVDDLNYTYGE